MISIQSDNSPIAVHRNYQPFAYKKITKGSTNYEQHVAKIIAFHPSVKPSVMSFVIIITSSTFRARKNHKMQTKKSTLIS